MTKFNANRVPEQPSHLKNSRQPHERQSRAEPNEQEMAGFLRRVNDPASRTVNVLRRRPLPDRRDDRALRQVVE